MKITLNQSDFRKLVALLATSEDLQELYNKLNTRLEAINISSPSTPKSSKLKNKTYTKKEQIYKIVDAPIVSERAKQGNAKYRKIAEDYRATRIKEQTKSEMITKGVLKAMKIPYDFQKIFYNEETFYIVDFYLPEYNTVIEIDGKYHEDPEQKLKDDRREKFLRRYNKIKYIGRIKNEDTFKTGELGRKIKAIIAHTKTIK